MKLLVTSGVFKESEAGVYSLTPVSRLLVEDDAEGGRACLSPFAILATSPFHLRSSQRLTEWMENEEEDAAAETPFMMAHGAGFYGYAGRDLELGALFNEAMGADSRVTAGIVVRRGVRGASVPGRRRRWGWHHGEGHCEGLPAC
jgi:hypothetical protein